MSVLQAMNPGRHGMGATLRRLERDDLVRQVGPGNWALTEAGRDEATRRRNDEGAGS
jgi:Mn-dependent DtxR family transcriptional regulator